MIGSDHEKKALCETKSTFISIQESENSQTQGGTHTRHNNKGSPSQMGRGLLVNLTNGSVESESNDGARLSMKL